MDTEERRLAIANALNELEAAHQLALELANNTHDMSCSRIRKNAESIDGSIGIIYRTIKKYA